MAEDPDTAAQVELLLAIRAAGVTHVGGRGITFTTQGRQQLARLISGVAQLSPQNQEAILRIVESMASSTETDDQRKE